MAVDAYDATYHHIGLGVDTSHLKGFLVAGAYSKQVANPVISKPSNVGTADLVGLRSLSNLTQDDYSGGEGQEDWSDPAMFSECVSMLPDQLTRRIRTIRPLKDVQTGDTQANISPISLEHVGGYLFLVFNNNTPTGKIYRYTPSDPTTGAQKETINSAYLPAGKLITAVGWNRAAGRMWIGSNEPAINTFAWDGSAASGSRHVHKNTYQAPSNVSSITGIHIFGKMKFIVTINRDSSAFAIGEDDSVVWLYVSGTGSSTKWTNVGALPGNFVKALTYNNAVYILSRGAGSSDDRSYLSMTQGSQVFPVVEFPYFFKASNMVEYAGRLYVSGTGYDLDGNDHHGELYEVSGASLRLVRSFAVERWQPDSSTVTSQLGPGGSNGTNPVKRARPMLMMKGLAVCEGLLWMPDSSWTGLEAYDATTDAFYGGPRWRSGNDTSVEFTNLIPYGDSLYAWGKGGTTAKTGLFRTERRSDTGSAYEPYIITSDYAPEPAQLKAWSRFVVVSRGVKPNLDYSTDGGDSWTSAGTGSSDVSGNTRITTFDLAAAGIETSKRIRFKIRFPMTGSANEAASFLTAHSLSFMVRGDTKRRWSFTVIAATQVENLNQDTTTQTPADVSSTIWSLKDELTPIAFRDLDGIDYNVVITDVSDHHSAIDPDAERFVQVALLEV